MTKELTIKQVVCETGLSVHALRYYERIDLMNQAGCAAGGHRRYTGEDLEWIILFPASTFYGHADFVREGAYTVPERRSLLETHERKLKA